MKNISAVTTQLLIMMLVAFSSLLPAQSKLAMPKSNIKSGIYHQEKVLMLSCTDKKAKIYYSTDGSEPNEKSILYTDPLILQKTVLIKSVAVKRGKKSDLLALDFTLLENINSLVLTNNPSKTYPVNNVYSILDGRPAGENYTDGSWLAFEGDDFEAVITFEKFTSISEVYVSCLQKTDSKIYFPTQLEYYVSPDGKNFIPAGILQGESLTGSEKLKTGRFQIPCRSAVVKAVKIKAKNIGVCPKDQPGVGEKAWLFINKIDLK